MSQITRSYTFTDGTDAYGSQVESEISGIVTAVNNLDSGAATWNLVRIANGSVTTPSFAFGTDTDTGMYLGGANFITFATGGADSLSIAGVGSGSAILPGVDNVYAIGSTAIGFTRIFLQNGSAAAPAFTFRNNSTTGIYAPTNNTLGFAANGVLYLTITAAGLFGFNTASPVATNGGADIASGGISLVLGADASAITRTDATQKRAIIGVAHYTNAQPPMSALYAITDTSTSKVFMGGGNLNVNAATDLFFYTAANTTTVVGSQRLQISTGGNIVPGTAALATTATDGFIYLQSCAGTPTGVPTSFTGRVACIYDSSANKIWVYSGSWRGVVVA